MPGSWCGKVEQIAEELLLKLEEWIEDNYLYLNDGGRPEIVRRIARFLEERAPVQRTGE